MKVLTLPKKLNGFIIKYEGLFVLLTVFLALFAFIDTKKQLKLAQDEIKINQINNAWEILGRKVNGNSGKKEAIETLLKNQVELVGIELSSKINGSNQKATYGTYLKGLDLSNMLLPNLSHANFDGTNLEDSKFIKANLGGASFIGSNLRYTKFKNTNLRGSNFISSDLFMADFRGARGILEAKFSNCYVSASDTDFIENMLPAFDKGTFSVTLKKDKNNNLITYKRNKNGELFKNPNGKYYKIDIKKIQ
jgi:hypothetical protein